MAADELLLDLSDCVKRRKKCDEELAEAKITIRSLSNVHLRARTEISDLKKKLAEVQKELAEVEEARTMRFTLPESWGWSDCFFCSEPIKDNANYDTFMSKSIHKECREKLIDGLNANQRKKEAERDE